MIADRERECGRNRRVSESCKPVPAPAQLQLRRAARVAVSSTDAVVEHAPAACGEGKSCVGGTGTGTEMETGQLREGACGVAR